MSPTNKEKSHNLNNVNIEEKIDALNQLKRGVNKNDIATKLNVNVRTVQNWVKNEDRLREWFKQHKGDYLKERKRMIVPINRKIDIALMIWFHQHRLAGIPITCSILKIQALHFWKIFGGTKDFKASDGWLSRWKTQFGIKSTTAGGEKPSSDSEGAKKFKTKFISIIQRENLTPHAIFNCDQTGLNWKQMPRNTLKAPINTNAFDYQVQKERLTVLACSNAAGSFKLPLVVIGNSEHAKTLDDIRNRLPVVYYDQTSSWMTTAIFKDWFYKHFVPTVEEFLKSRDLPANAVLFMDNWAVYPENLKVRNIRVEFLPPNTTLLIQPMDQGCLQAIKSKYRMQLISFLIGRIQSGFDMLSALNDLTIRKVIYWLHYSWDSVAPVTIIDTWKPLWPEVEEMVKISNFCEVLFQNLPESTNNLNTSRIVQEFYDNLKMYRDFEDVNMIMVNNWAQCTEQLTEDEFLADSEIVQCVSEEYDGSSGGPSPIQPEQEDECELHPIGIINKDKSLINNATIISEDQPKEKRNKTMDINEQLIEKKDKLLKIKEYLNKTIDHCQNKPQYDPLVLFNLNMALNIINE